MEPKKSDKSGVQKQVHLPLSRAFEISLKNIKTRFGRSIITAAGIFLGIAFLVSVLMQGVLKWPAPPDNIKTGLVQLDGEINAPGPYDAWKNVTKAELAEAGMPAAAIAYASQDMEEFPLRQFAEGVTNLKIAGERKITAKAWLDEFKGLPKAKLAAPKDDGKFTRDDLLKKYGMSKKGVKKLLDTNDSITEKDMVVAVNKAKTSLKYWTNRKAELEIFRSVNKNKLAGLAAKKAYSIDEVITFAKSTTKNAELAGVMIVNTNGRRIEVDLNDKQKNKEITVDQGDYLLIPDAASGYRRLWLVIMSLLVCTLGICNSMLMSVTERFKEIGTMKCLGALDKFVVTLFLLESMFLGMVASFLGWLIGFLGMLLMAGVSQGWAAVAQMSFMDALMVFVEAIAAGAFLTVVATIAPAIQAAKMPPAAALRVEI